MAETIGEKKRVLLVGDSRHLADAGDGLWRRAVVDVQAAERGLEALALHRTSRADLIVVDLDLPDMNAERFCELVRADRTLRRVSLLVLCGDDEAERRRAAECQANAHTIRPVDPADFGAQLARLIEVPLRATYRVLLRVSLEGPARLRSFFCTSENVSASGILIETDETLTLGDQVTCSFFLPGGARVNAPGRVAREGQGERGRQYGVEFADLAQDQAAAIESFVEVRAQRALGN